MIAKIVIFTPVEYKVPCVRQMDLYPYKNALPKALEPNGNKTVDLEILKNHRPEPH